MIVLQNLNVVREVASEAEAIKLESKGFQRKSGQAESVSEAGGITERDFAKMGEAMFERLQKKLQEAVKSAAAAPTAAPQPESEEKADDVAPLDKEEKDGRKAAGKDNGNGKK